MQLDTLTQIAQTLGSSDVVVLATDDWTVVKSVLQRLRVEDLLTEEESFRLALVQESAWVCPSAAKVSL